MDSHWFDEMGVCLRSTDQNETYLDTGTGFRAVFFRVPLFTITSSVVCRCATRRRLKLSPHLQWRGATWGASTTAWERYGWPSITLRRWGAPEEMPVCVCVHSYVPTHTHAHTHTHTHLNALCSYLCCTPTHTHAHTTYMCMCNA